jgi:hypothetical protein
MATSDVRVLFLLVDARLVSIVVIVTDPELLRERPSGSPDDPISHSPYGFACDHSQNIASEDVPAV